MEDVIGEMVVAESDVDIDNPFSSSSFSSSPSPFRLSYSSISSYLSCPKKYQYNKILNVPSERGNPIMTYGSCMHYCIEQYWKYKQSNQDNAIEMDVNVKEYEKYMEQIFSTIWYVNANALFDEEEGGKRSGKNVGGVCELTSFAPMSMHHAMGEQGIHGLKHFVNENHTVKAPQYNEIMFSIQMNEMEDPIGMVEEKDDW